MVPSFFEQIHSKHALHCIQILYIYCELFVLPPSISSISSISCIHSFIQPASWTGGWKKKVEIDGRHFSFVIIQFNNPRELRNCIARQLKNCTRLPISYGIAKSSAVCESNICFVTANACSQMLWINGNLSKVRWRHFSFSFTTRSYIYMEYELWMWVWCVDFFLLFFHSTSSMWFRK